ncbi:MAG: hypothetical protein HC902_08970 [Calothrix sp. SM1_5_4]|nr:hypothetical protein [Calothrix sp. SM1_5_4]
MSSKRALLLINLGSPEAPRPREVRSYLNEFLTDPYVIDLPYVPRQILVRAIISPFRAKASAHAYDKIWTKDGSPLVHFTRSFSGKVAETLGAGWDVRWAMRYGSPSVAERMRDWDYDELYIVPLYPQYAESSSRTASEEALRHSRSGAKVLVLRDFFAEPEFIRAQVERINGSLLEFQADHLLLSFHGLPEHHLHKLYPAHCLRSASCCDSVTSANRFCYRAQCFATARGDPRIPAVRRRQNFSRVSVAPG